MKNFKNTLMVLGLCLGVAVPNVLNYKDVKKVDALEVQWDEACMTIPIEIIWDDDDNSCNTRPTELTVKYKFKDRDNRPVAVPHSLEEDLEVEKDVKQVEKAVVDETEKNVETTVVDETEKNVETDELDDEEKVVEEEEAKDVENVENVDDVDDDEMAVFAYEFVDYDVYTRTFSIGDDAGWKHDLTFFPFNPGHTFNCEITPPDAYESIEEASIEFPEVENYTLVGFDYFEFFKNFEYADELAEDYRDYMDWYGYDDDYNDLMYYIYYCCEYYEAIADGAEIDEPLVPYQVTYKLNDDVRDSCEAPEEPVETPKEPEPTEVKDPEPTAFVPEDFPVMIKTPETTIPVTVDVDVKKKEEPVVDNKLFEPVTTKGMHTGVGTLIAEPLTMGMSSLVGLFLTAFKRKH